MQERQGSVSVELLELTFGNGGQIQEPERFVHDLGPLFSERFGRSGKTPGGNAGDNEVVKPHGAGNYGLGYGGFIIRRPERALMMNREVDDRTAHLRDSPLCRQARSTAPLTTWLVTDANIRAVIVRDARVRAVPTVTP